MVKLLQNFDTFELRQEQDAPEGSLPPASWKKTTGRAVYEQIWPRNAVTLYAKVRLYRLHFERNQLKSFQKGGCVDLHENSEVSRVSARRHVRVANCMIRLDLCHVVAN